MNHVVAPYAPAADASAWHGPDMAAHSEAWTHHLTGADLDELAAALATARGGGLATEAITRADFPLPTLAKKLATWGEEARTGRGFFLLRGLPPARFDEAARETIFWGIGQHLGTPVSQNSHGQVLGHVYDQGRVHGSPNTRGYQTAARLDYHTDRCDLVGLLCQRKAKAGGLSSIVSTTAVHDEILRRRPDLLPVLYRGFHYGHREAADAADGVTPEPIPIFSRHQGWLSIRFIRNSIELGLKRRGIPWTADEQAAMDLMGELTSSPEFRLDMDLEPGDMQWCNNYVTAHSRTAFEDHEQPERKRLMVRLWLSFPERRPLAPDFGEHDGIPAKLATEAPPMPARAMATVAAAAAE